MPTRDRERHLTRCLTALYTQRLEGGRLEIIVVDDSDSGLAQEVAERVGRSAPSVSGPPSLVVVSSGRAEGASGGVNQSRNRGLEVASGDLVAFLDDDIEVGPDWAARLRETVRAHPDAGCIGGAYLLHPEDRPCFPCGRDHLAHLSFCPEGPAAPRPVEEVWGANFAVRRSAIEEVGPFDASLSGAGDEIEWQVRWRRAGGKILFDPGLKARHWRHDDELELMSLMRAKFFRERTRPRLWLRLSPGSHGLATHALRSQILALRCLAHAARYRCRGGLIDASGYVGLSFGCFRALFVSPSTWGLR